MEVIRPLQHTTQRGPEEWFTGTVYIDPIATGPHVKLLSVHFTPGARTAWHTHPLGQTIFVTEGVGLCRRRGGEGRECEDLVTQLAAVSKALDRAGFTLIAGGLRQGLAAEGDPSVLDTDKMERLFLSLA